MNPLHRIAGRVVDRLIGRTLLGDHYRPAGPDRALPVVLIRSTDGRSGGTGTLFAAPLARRGGPHAAGV